MLASSPSVSAASFECARVVQNVQLGSSRGLGWTSLLLDRHMLKGSGDYISLPTPDQTIVLASAGRFTFDVCNGGRWRHSQRDIGSLGMRRGGEITRSTYAVDAAVGSAEILVLYLPHELLTATQDHLGRIGQRWVAPSFNALVEKDQIVSQMMLSLQRAVEQGVDNLYAESAAAWLAVHLCTLKSAAGSDLRDPGALSDRRLHRVLELIDARFAEALSLDALAAEACISRFHFVRLFREKVGTTPYAYIANVRLETASRLLTTSDLAVGDVARRCGFSSAASFATAFRAKYRMTPTAHRASARPG